MNRQFVVALAAAALIFTVLSLSAISWYSSGVELQEATIAQYQDNQNRYDSFWKSVQETAQVPDKYKNDMKEIVLGEGNAKFGNTGSKALMQWFQERDLRPSPQLYVKVQDAIMVGRKDFQRGQRTLLDKQRRARAHLHKPFGQIVSAFADPFDEVYGKLAPPSDLDGDGRLTIFDYDIVTSKRTKKAFDTGEDAPVNVFGK